MLAPMAAQERWDLTREQMIESEGSGVILF